MKLTTIAGISYKSRAAAAAALGVTQHAVYKAVQAGDVDRLVIGRQGGATPVTVHGVRFTSIRDAAAAYGVTHGSICSRLDRGTLDKLPPLFRPIACCSI